MANASFVSVRPVPGLAWYAVRTRSKQERVAASLIESKGLEPYLPLVRSRRRWSDRTKELEVPLFPGYLFCRFDPACRVSVLSCAGVVGIVGFGPHPVAIPESEIRSVRTVIESCLHIEPLPYLQPGRKIRIEHGPLAGAEGVVVQVKAAFRLVASITLLQRSVSVEIDRAWVAPVAPERPSLITRHALNHP